MDIVRPTDVNLDRCVAQIIISSFQRNAERGRLLRIQLVLCNYTFIVSAEKSYHEQLFVDKVTTSVFESHSMLLQSGLHDDWDHVALDGSFRRILVLRAFIHAPTCTSCSRRTSPRYVTAFQMHSVPYSRIRVMFCRYVPVIPPRNTCHEQLYATKITMSTVEPDSSGSNATLATASGRRGASCTAPILHRRMLLLW